MISFMRADAISTAAPDHHIVYASNAAIARRAHVSVATVERQVSRLVALGLIERICARNGKRWARRTGAGQVVLVSGLSLLPLSLRHEEFLDLTSRHRALQERLMELRDSCLLALARLQDRADDLLNRASKVLRRKPDLDQLQALLAEIVAAQPVDNSCETSSVPSEMRDGSMPDEGHKEHPDNSESKEWGEAGTTAADMARSFPLLCEELTRQDNEGPMDRVMDDLARQFGLGQVWTHCREEGPQTAFVLLGHLMERAHRVRNHRAYMAAMIARVRQGEVTLPTLIRPRKRRIPVEKGLNCKHEPVFT